MPFRTSLAAPYFQYRIIHQSKVSNARVGQIITPHGIIDTPGFVPVGTNGAMKGVSQSDLTASGLELMFSNTYHLLLHPGPETISAAGGLHQFMNRSQPLITDSGGFQVFSLCYGSVENELSMKAGQSRGKYRTDATVLKIDEEGVTFRSYRDGRRIKLTPESSVQAQKSFGADIIIPFDELPPYHISQEKLKESVLRTHRWEERSLNEHLKSPNQQAMYGVLHGGIDQSLRQMSVDYLTKLEFDGYAIGGSIGKNRTEMIDLLKFLMPQLPVEKPNHLLGIADEPSIRESVPLGVDTFDSCFPTRAGRHGTILSSDRGKISIRSGKWRNCFDPIDRSCPCPACRNHSIAYIHHLFKANEPNAIVLASTHNLFYMGKLMSDLRQAILRDEI